MRTVSECRNVRHTIMPRDMFRDMALGLGPIGAISRRPIESNSGSIELVIGQAVDVKQTGRGPATVVSFCELP
jgi:hypothetical protein